ncbi:dephospho-CoA kinase [uncultured Muribaculum sp.]|uniref:dephospho-CoA kinase n=1 Tax=uncultured Muribaculum sp. TaxID=1918613 RepID=UPI0025D1B615|nr:dephospho-CoA kinase [uncultured Muribaculum sp.]
MKITAITGGIGSGKSVVSEMLRTLGHPVYDCDSRAKKLMDADDEIKQAISSQICAEAITADGHIDRKHLAEKVFADAELLERLNSIVHGAVRADFIDWAANTGAERVWMETALLYESGLDKVATDVWEVTAPEELRIKRVMRRNAMNAGQVKARIEAQRRNAHPERHQCVEMLVNDGVQPLLPQVLALL